MGKESTFRGFIGLPLGGAAAASLVRRTRARLAVDGGPSGGRWRVVPAERLHLTLKFLGPVPTVLLRRTAEGGPGPFEALLLRVAAMAGPVRSLTGGVHLLPSVRHPTVLALGLSDPADTLSTMASALDRGASGLGFPRETRPFFPHITVARRGPGGGTGAGPVTTGASLSVAASGVEGDDGPLELRFDELVLYRSESVPTRGGRGPRYEGLLRVPLSGGAEGLPCVGAGLERSEERNGRE